MMTWNFLPHVECGKEGREYFFGLGGQNSPGQISPFVSAKSALGKYVGWHISPTVFFLWIWIV